MPPTISDVTSEWLTDVLVRSSVFASGQWVSELRTERIGAGRGLLAEVHRVTYRRAPDGACGSIVVKVAATNELRQAADALGVYAREVSFYRDLAAGVPLRSPRIHAAAADVETSDFVIVMEDLQHLAAADQLRGLSADEAGAALETLAPMHAWAWEASPRLAEVGTAIPPLDCDATRSLYPGLFAAGWAAYLSHCSSEQPASLAKAAARWPEQLTWMLCQLSRPTTLCHGDFRADNLFTADDGAITVVDFQLTHLGCGISDVAYLVAQSTSGLGADEHADLVRRYVVALARANVDYPWERAWHQYRVAVVFHLVEAVAATLSWPSLEERGRTLVMRLVERTGAAIDAVDALDVVPG